MVARGCRVHVGVALSFAAAVAVWLVAAAPGAAQPRICDVCQTDSDCDSPLINEPNVGCVLGRCINLGCNADVECPGNRPFCAGGTCTDFPCDGDADCGGGRICDGGHCTDHDAIDCTAADDCAAGQRCVDHECVDCDGPNQCGPNGLCEDNRCVCVECTRSDQCAEDETCSLEEHRCVPLCNPPEIYVAASDGNRLCEACVNPDTARRCNEFPGCRFPAGRTLCAAGFCIPRCSLDPPDFDDLRDRFPRLDYQPDPDGLPDCPECGAIFELAGVRLALERAGVDQPVTLRLVDQGGKTVADFGTAKPNKGSWAALPLRAQPKLGAKLAAGGCDYALEIKAAGPRGGSVSAPVCLRQRK